jgi:hypothetical protein
MPNVTVGTKSSAPGSTVERIPPGFHNTAAVNTSSATAVITWAQ